MQHRALAISVALVLPALAACSGTADGADEGAETTADTSTEHSSPPVPPTDSSTTARKAERRVPFLGGAFVTWSGAMPAEVRQAAAGERTDRPVVVWAGLDATHIDRAEPHPHTGDVDARSAAPAAASPGPARFPH